ncbi:hypothetical protein ACWM35_06865 [Neobacillus sp. K501]
MKNHFKDEQGYTLVLTLFVILLFTLLGASLMAATIGGAQKTKIRQVDIQSTELANNGVEYITAKINTELKDALGTNGLTRSEFITKLNNTLVNYQDTTNPISNTGETGDYKVYISKIEPSYDRDGKENPLRKKVTFISKGTADGKEEQITSVVEIGAQSVLETLKYAVGANKCTGTNCTQFNGEGNMFLHGGVTIQGDFKVDNNLITTDRGYAYLGGERWIESLYPSILPIQGSTQPLLVIGGNVYTFNHSPTYNNHISSTYFGSSYTNRTNNLNEAFYNNNKPTIVKRDVPRDEINIGNQKSVYYFSETGAILLNGENTTVFYNNLDYPTQKVYASYKECEYVKVRGQYVWTCSSPRFDGVYIFNANNSFGSFATKGSLKIESSPSSLKTTKFNNGAYIENNLSIGNGSSSYDISSYDKLRIDGPIYVNGDVTIKGANAEFNSIMYVNGNVTIENSQLKGLGTTGSLIIFAKGNINIRNNSVNQDNPSNIKGFFYSEQALEIFGVGSNIRIEGGVSARRIVLNAIRGRASDSSFSGSQRITYSDYFEGRTNQPNKTSRLQIIYDSNIMNTYSDIKSREPIVKNVDVPQLIDRQ